MKNAIASTGLIVAAMREEESSRADRLFEDPFATRLAGDDGRALLAKYKAAVGPSVPIIEVRTRFFDEGLLRAHAKGVRQFVVLAAGMDARAFRLGFDSRTRVFELDQREVLEEKMVRLGNASPKCERVAVVANLAGDWVAALRAAGFDTRAPTAWLIEGLLQYIPEQAVVALFEGVNSLSAQGSELLYDVVGRTLLQAPMLKPTLAFMDTLGAPWIFASDEPGKLAERHGWRVAASDPGAVGTAWNRWPFPIAPHSASTLQQGALVEATKGS
jgi:methyltransferase (TIGR00027 family)